MEKDDVLLKSAAIVSLLDEPKNAEGVAALFDLFDTLKATLDYKPESFLRVDPLGQRAMEIDQVLVAWAAGQRAAFDMIKDRIQECRSLITEEAKKNMAGVDKAA